MVELYEHQRLAVEKLKNGSILCGGVGSGKSRTSLAYFVKDCSGVGRDLYIITTASKRDTGDWNEEAAVFGINQNKESSFLGIKLTVDSWNNIYKYVDIENAFFIFDEQRVCGSGLWVKSFLKITKKNRWILLSATPGDTWTDYIPVFIANGFYKNRTHFFSEHVVFDRFAKYPKIKMFLHEDKLIRFRKDILVEMKFNRIAKQHHAPLIAGYDKALMNRVVRDRWDPYDDCPIQEVGKLYYLMRKVVNSSEDRVLVVRELLQRVPKAIIFYNFDYELEILKTIASELGRPLGELNGHHHTGIPKADCWIYLVQYAAGNEAWNCIETDTIIFYSQNYSYKVMIQSAGRIDRLNTPYSDLWYYYVKSEAKIDFDISLALSRKKKFNEMENYKNEYFRDS